MLLRFEKFEPVKKSENSAIAVLSYHVTLKKVQQNTEQHGK